MDGAFLHDKHHRNISSFVANIVSLFLSSSRADGALNTINQNLNDQHIQMRKELQDRHTDITNDVNQYTTCSKFISFA